MDEIIGKLKHEWNADKAKQSYAQDHERIIKLSAEKMKNARTQHLWNISILSFTLLGISAFFIFVASFQELFSHFGIALMTGGLLVRIIVEISSIYKAKNINMTDSAAVVNHQFVSFHQHRKSIHGSLTTSILILYTIGFSMLMPEFARYVSTTSIVLIILSYLAGAIVVGFFIRSGIRKEMTYLNDLTNLQEDLSE